MLISGVLVVEEIDKCPYCGSYNWINYGHSYSKKTGLRKQIFHCNDCKRHKTGSAVEIAPPKRKLIDLKNFKYKSQPMPRQNWSAYTKAQNNEKRLLMETLTEILAQTKVIVANDKLGRKYSDMKDICFALVLKTYTRLSSRRLNSDLEKAQHEQFISKVPHFTTLMNWLEKEEMTDLLLELIKLAALPIKKVETQYAIDSSGFSSNQFGRWFNFVYGEETVCRNWVKAHITVGTKTNMVIGVELTKAHGADITQFIPLVEKVSKDFTVKEISADRIYISEKNLEIAISHGAMPYIPFKSNNISRGHGAIWKKMWFYQREHPQEFFEHYHRRSNVESTFSMIKQKFGKDVVTKNFQSQTNEVLLKILCHNICCLIQEYYENNLEKLYSTDPTKIPIKIRLS